MDAGKNDGLKCEYMLYVGCRCACIREDWTVMYTCQHIDKTHNASDTLNR